MEKLVIRLLEILRQLDEIDSGEFDFVNLKSALDEFAEQAPDILNISKEHNILKNHLILSIMGKLRVLKTAQPNGSFSVWEELVTSNPRLGAKRLLEIHAKLAQELNTILSTRPNFRKTCRMPDEQAANDEFKIGG
jgi:hypothetical protein